MRKPPKPIASLIYLHPNLISITRQYSNRAYRIAVSVLFFLQGLCFASWASRIPSIKKTLDLSDAGLGGILFMLPLGSMLALPLSGWLVTRFGSRKIAVYAVSFYALTLFSIGLAPGIATLAAALGFFGFAGNMGGIAINTQAINVETKYGRKIMASFHGLWSLAGFTAAGIGTLMIGRDIAPMTHFAIVSLLILAGIGISANYLAPDAQRHKASRWRIPRPDRPLILLGLIAFCCMSCEGAMFDWSGIYFQKIIGAEKDWIGIGYTAFMSAMTAMRFVADKITGRIGIRKLIRYSGLLIATGLGIAIAFPTLLWGTTGFFLVGIGVSSVVPLVYSEAGRSKSLSPGIALAAISGIGFLGFLIGPPLIGIVSGLFSLRISFLIISIMGIAIAILSRKISA